MTPSQSEGDNSLADRITRRTLLAAGTGALLGGATWLAMPEDASVLAAETGGLSIPNLDTESAPPTEMPLTVTGTWSVAKTDAPLEQVRAVLDVTANGTQQTVLDSDVTFDVAAGASGAYELSTDLLAHPGLDASAFELEVGASHTDEVEVVVRVEAVRGGETVDTVRLSETVMLTVTGAEVVAIETEASGNVTVKTA